MLIFSHFCLYGLSKKNNTIHLKSFILKKKDTFSFSSICSNQNLSHLSSLTEHRIGFNLSPWTTTLNISEALLSSASATHLNGVWKHFRSESVVRCEAKARLTHRAALPNASQPAEEVIDVMVSRHTEELLAIISYATPFIYCIFLFYRSL